MSKTYRIVQTFTEPEAGAEVYFVQLAKDELHSLQRSLAEAKAAAGAEWGHSIARFDILPGGSDETALCGFDEFIRTLAQEIRYSGTGEGKAIYANDVSALKERGIERD